MSRVALLDPADVGSGYRWSGRPIMIRKLKSGRYRLYSASRDPETGKRRNLGTFGTRAAAEHHEREVQFFKRRGPRGQWRR
jgi:hypothetical protein